MQTYTADTAPGAARRGQLAATTILALWLLSPTLMGIWFGGLGPDPAPRAVAVVLIASWLFALPLLVLGSVRYLFLFWLPVAFLVPLQCYLTYFFGSVPGDAITAAAIKASPAEAIDMVAGFGWMALLLPAAWIAYLLLWRRIDPALRLSAKSRKALAAALLMYAMVGLQGEQALGRTIALPPLFNESLASATYPAGHVISLARVLDTEKSANAPMVATHASAPADPQLLILVIGESVRPDHLGINGYARNTTPELARIGSELMSFSDVVSTANNTAAAVPNIARRATAGGNVSLVSMFREAGFRTTWFSNQQLTVYNPQADLSDFSTNNWHEKMRQDADLLPMLAACIKQCGPRQFVVLHMYGSHFPYDERYGRRDQVFTPTLRDAGFATAAPNFKTELINSYDNSLLGFDRFLANVIAQAGAVDKPALVLFTSDHGENLYDDERQMFMHAGPNPTRPDTTVPMLVWANAAYRAAHPGKIAALRATLPAPVNHLAILPTMLDLGGVDYDGKDPAQSLASGQFKPVEREVAGNQGQPINIKNLR
jgi:glucan phosphoethanolaminetransferase (alkaline phosphatase superfamily)